MDKSIQKVEKELFSRPLVDVVAELSYVRRLERVWQLVESDYADPDLNLEKAAEVAGANKNYLNVLFRRETSFTFHQFLVRYRVLKAISIMKTKNYSLLEVALQSGFGSLNTLERNFRTLLGTTPRDFKSKIYGE